MASSNSIHAATLLYSQFHRIPDEVLLQILHYLPKSVKHPKPQADVLNALSTCKHLAPLAREVLFCAPILYSSKADHFLASLFQYPDLRSKIRSLTIETKIRGMCIGPNPSPAISPELLTKAISHISTLDIYQHTKQQFTESLHAGNEFDGPSTLLSLVTTMLPNLQELYLGGSILYNFPFLQALFTSNSSLFPAHNPDLSPLLSLFSHKLTVLELPNDFRIAPSSQSDYRGSVHGIPRYFPELRTLMLPSDNVVRAYYKEVVPSKLERLVLTNCAVYQYTPDYSLWNTDGSFHPWLYDGIELDLSEAAMHEKGRRLDKAKSDERKKREARKIAWGRVAGVQNQTKL
ncbi:hypothetical protein BKA58DRAFT_462398 [Alternaria rosae]|uniref:uncharacterized protein n=1 Tax=Alternaria rosae TaxID=1187941 RepID=UPI001E8E81EA|nr:uncharacterized protein BKA58DRAFT_462398 [Alternaria rosae]KAH6864934.1 hypothetical protein BKA58DRAFT_462398 [Alternaria rosae]